MSDPLPFRITQRDVAILRAIARYRFLTADLAHVIVGGSRRGVSNRLRLLAAYAFLVRVATVVTEPLAYGLTNKGAQLSRERAVVINDRLDWTGKNKTTFPFVAHTVAVAETMLLFQGAADHNA